MRNVTLPKPESAQKEHIEIPGFPGEKQKYRKKI
jgi:hypothetical protein